MMAKQQPPTNRFMNPVLIWIVVFLVAYAAWVFLSSRKADRIAMERRWTSGSAAQPLGNDFFVTSSGLIKMTFCGGMVLSLM